MTYTYTITKQLPNNSTLGIFIYEYNNLFPPNRKTFKAKKINGKWVLR